MIPNVDLIFDRSSIITQIYHEQKNPYTREELTIDCLNEYNQKEEIVKKIEDWKQKYINSKET